MKTQDAYNHWAVSYDSMPNKTRDLEALVVRDTLSKIKFDKVLEIGCGTGKNTEWLAGQCKKLTAVDFSNEMLEQAKQKNKASHVRFQQADITKPWAFEKADLVTCSLVLEHIENLSFIFEQAADCLLPGGHFYICELHPFKQLQGSMARFEHEGNLVQLEYFIHHLSDYFNAAKDNWLTCVDMQEWFDTDNRNETPRLCSLLFKKN